MDVSRCEQLPPGELQGLLARVGLRVCRVAIGAPIPGSFCGEPEAGLIGDRLYAPVDTPVHSALHEACHWICMPPARGCWPVTSSTRPGGWLSRAEKRAIRKKQSGQ